MDSQLAKKLDDNELAVKEVEAAIAKKIRDDQTKLAKLRVEGETLRTAIMQHMEKNDIKKVETDHLAITYVAPTVRNGLYTTKIKEEAPEIYQKYLKQTPVKASIRIKVKGV